MTTFHRNILQLDPEQEVERIVTALRQQILSGLSDAAACWA